MDISSVGSQFGNGPVTEPAPAEQAAERRNLIKAASVIEAHQALGENNELVFMMDRASRRPIMRVIDRDTKEVLMQLPPEYVLRLAEDLQNASSEADMST